MRFRVKHSQVDWWDVEAESQEDAIKAVREVGDNTLTAEVTPHFGLRQETWGAWNLVPMSPLDKSPQ